MRLRRPIRSTLLVAAALIGLLAPTVAIGADQTVTFERPTARTSGFGVYWSQRFVSTKRPIRVELMSRIIGQEAWLVDEVPIDVLEGRRRYASSSFAGPTYPPNTRLEYRFRVTPNGGPPETGPIGKVTVNDDRIDWKTLEGDLVRLHWQTGDEAFARRALQIAETSVAKTSALLGVTETDPIDFFVYADPDEFQSALGPGTKEFVAGRAVPEIRTLFGRILPDQIGSDWVPLVIGHELAHLVFDTATRNPYHEPPHWMNEGLATYLVEGYSDEWRQRVANAIDRDTLLPLTSITDGFPSVREDLFYLGYGEGASAIDFFVRTYGQEKLVELIRSYAVGVTDDEAFEAATGEGFKAFEAAWLSDIGADEPEVRGPRDARPGPTPGVWAGRARPVPTDAGVSSGVLPGEPGPNASDVPPVAIAVVLVAVGMLAIIAFVIVRRRRARAVAIPLETAPSAAAAPEAEPPPWDEP